MTILHAHWSSSAENNFEQIKSIMTKTPVLTSLDSNNLFMLECDASNKGIGIVLTQDGKPTLW